MKTSFSVSPRGGCPTSPHCTRKRETLEFCTSLSRLTLEEGWFEDPTFRDASETNSQSLWSLLSRKDQSLGAFRLISLINRRRNRERNRVHYRLSWSTGERLFRPSTEDRKLHRGFIRLGRSPWSGFKLKPKYTRSIRV